MKSTIIAFLILCLCAAGCNSDKKAAELLDTARFEEKQHNRDHAAKLYEEIIQKYPNTSAATTAKARLSELKP